MFNNKSKGIKFSPKKTKLSKNIPKNFSRNPNLFNYSKNKKLFIPINVMNLVSFINSERNEAKNSIPAINILSKIKPINKGENQNYFNKSKPPINNNGQTEGKAILQNYQQNYVQNKNSEILRQSAFNNGPISPILNNNNNDNNINNFNNINSNKNINYFSVPYNNNKNNIVQKNMDNFNLNYNNENSSLKFVHFNNIMLKKRNSYGNFNNLNNNNYINNQYS